MGPIEQVSCFMMPYCKGATVAAPNIIPPLRLGVMVSIDTLMLRLVLTCRLLEVAYTMSNTSTVQRQLLLGSHEDSQTELFGSHTLMLHLYRTI